MTRKLKEIFKFKFEILRRALEENDVAEAKRILKKNDRFFSHILRDHDNSKQTREMAEMFIRDFGEKDWERWGFRAGAREAVLRMFFKETLLAGRVDLVDTYFGAGLPFRTGEAESHEIAMVLKSKMNDATKTALAQRFIYAGIDKIENPQALLETAITAGSPDVFAMLVAAMKKDIHNNNEQLLRYAGEAGQAEMVRHLVQKHGANIELAIITERTQGHDKAWRFLEGERQKIYPGESAPPTLDSLAEEMRKLKNELLAVREEMKSLRAQQPVPLQAQPVTAAAPALLKGP